MGSDELNAGKTNPFMSKELFNYVWLINPNPSIPLTIYLFNQVPMHSWCCSVWVVMVRWRKKEKKRERMRVREREKNWGCKTIHLEEANTSQMGIFFVVLANSSDAYSPWVPASQLLLTSKGQRSLCLKRFQVERQRWWVSIPLWHADFFFFFLLASWEKGNLKTSSPV